MSGPMTREHRTTRRPKAAPAQPGLRVSCFGKVPTHGDFVRDRSGAPAAPAALDRWVQHGLYHARSRLQGAPGPAFEPAFDAMPPHRFVFSPTVTGEVMMGVMAPSRDEAGRRYPFVAAGIFPETRERACEVARHPVRRRALLSACEALARESAAGTVSYRDLPARARALDHHQLDPSQKAQGTYERFLQATSWGVFAEAVWDDFEDARKYVLFKNLVDALVPLRRGVPARCSLGLRFPLSERARAAHAVAFWTELALALLGAPNVAPTAFWSTGTLAAARGPTLLLFLRPPAANAFVHLMTARVATDNVCDLEAAGRSRAARAALGIPARYGRLIESPERTLHDLLQAVRQ